MVKVRAVQRRPIRPGLSTLDEFRLRRSLRRSAPSEPWVDAQLVSFHDRGPGGDPIAYRFHDPRVFPPGGRAATAMRWCRACGRYTPAGCVSLIESRRRRGGEVVHATLHCDDCRIAEDVVHFRSLYEALPNLRPGGSLSFVQMRDRPNRANPR